MTSQSDIHSVYEVIWRDEDDSADEYHSESEDTVTIITSVKKDGSFNALKETDEVCTNDSLLPTSVKRKLGINSEETFNLRTVKVIKIKEDNDTTGSSLAEFPDPVCSLCFSTGKQNQQWLRCRRCNDMEHFGCRKRCSLPVPKNAKERTCFTCFQCTQNEVTRTEGISDDPLNGEADVEPSDELTKVAFYMHSLIELPLGNKERKRIKVTQAELHRRANKPECFSAHALRRYVRIGSNEDKIDAFNKKLASMNIIPNKRIQECTHFSLLTETDTANLSRDFISLLEKYVAKDILKDTTVNNASILKASDALKCFLDTFQKRSKAFDLATHGFGFSLVQAIIGFINECLVEKLHSLGGS